MVRRCLKGGALALAIVAGLFLGQQAACLLLPAQFDSDSPGSSTPVVELPYREQDFGVVSQGTVLHGAFSVSNVGGRRLILVERSRTCCGQSPEKRETVLPPGQATELRIQVDTSRYCGRMREVVRYQTNDPEMPQFALSVIADVTASAKPAEEADPGSGQPSYSLP
jgi:hypothetical protein